MKNKFDFHNSSPFVCFQTSNGLMIGYLTIMCLSKFVDIIVV